MKILDASGTGYLGLQRDPAWLAEVSEQLVLFGSNHPLSRLNQNKDFEVLVRVETLVAKMLGCEAACLFSSGYLAGLAMSRFFAEKALSQKMALALPSNHHPCLAPPVGWSCKSAADIPRDRGWIAFGQTIDPIFGRIDPSITHPLFRNASWRVLDCSHSVGLWDHHSWVDERTLFVGSLGKACAFPAGFVAGPKAILDELKKSGSFCGAAPPSIAFSAAFLNFTQQHHPRRTTLWRLLDLVNHQFKRIDHSDQRVPVYFLGQPGTLARQTCEAVGFHLSWLRYPNPDAPLYLRLVVKANQDPLMLADCCDFLKSQGLSLQKPPNPSTDWHFFLGPG